MNIALGEAALALKQGNSPVGAVVVKDGTVIAKGHNFWIRIINFLYNSTF